VAAVDLFAAPPPIRAACASSHASRGGGAPRVVVSQADALPVGVVEVQTEWGRAEACVRGRAALGCAAGEKPPTPYNPPMGWRGHL